MMTRQEMKTLYPRFLLIFRFAGVARLSQAVVIRPEVNAGSVILLREHGHRLGQAAGRELTRLRTIRLSDRARRREVDGGGRILRQARQRRADIPRYSMQATVWTEGMQSELRRAFRRGKYGAARAAFPTMTRGQVQGAIRRFVFDFDTANAAIGEVITPAEARQRLVAFDNAAFLEGVARLLEDGHRALRGRRIA